MSSRESKERKRTKKKEAKEGDACGNCRSRGNRLRWPSADVLLDDFLRCLENPAGFSTVTTSAAAAINFKTINKRGGSLLLHRGGLLLRCQKHTGLSGKFDFSIQFFREPAVPQPN